MLIVALSLPSIFLIEEADQDQTYVTHKYTERLSNSTFGLGLYK